MYTEVAVRKNSRSFVVAIMIEILTANGDFLIAIDAQKSGGKESSPVCFQRPIKMAINRSIHG